MILEPGALYSATYLRWHEDKNPLLFVLFSNLTYTIGLNVHYIPETDYGTLVKMFLRVEQERKLKRMFFTDNREWYYDYLKRVHKALIDQAYRSYFSGLLQAIRVDPILRTAEIGSKWKESRKPNSPEEKLRKRAKKDPLVRKLRDEFKERNYTMKQIKLTKENWRAVH